jgi:hypothetical protein
LTALLGAGAWSGEPGAFLLTLGEDAAPFMTVIVCRVRRISNAGREEEHDFDSNKGDRKCSSQSVTRIASSVGTETVSSTDSYSESDRYRRDGAGN